MAACAACTRQHARKPGTASEKCSVCGDRICRRHIRREDGIILCADDAREARREASRRIREMEPVQ